MTGVRVQVKLGYTDHMNFIGREAVELIRLSDHSMIPYDHTVRNYRQRPFANKIVPTLHQTENRNAALFGFLDDMQVGTEQSGKNDQVRLITIVESRD